MKLEKKIAVITGDMEGFSALPPAKREKIIKAAGTLITGWVKEAGQAQIFRGDSFQFLLEDTFEALRRSIQLRCWFIKNSVKGQTPLDARMAVGIGSVSYLGKTVLDSDGEAFHLSGRGFDAMNKDEHLRVITARPSVNEQLAIILQLTDVIMEGWTVSQAEVIYQLLEGKTQQQMAAELDVVQSAIHNRIRLARWKTIDSTIRYIAKIIDNP